MLDGREILLGVSGSIAAYKAAELARLLIKKGANVQVVMTRSACEFITPLTFFSLTGRQAYSELFSGGEEVATAHISLARQADLTIVAPATARTLSRIATGSAEDLLSTAIIAAHGPVILAPAMNPQMYQHPGVQNNLRTLQSWPQYHIAPPGSGEMACGEFGLGRLAEPADLVAFCESVLRGDVQDLVGHRILVTAGPTLEDIDPVRYITNRSTGKMGFAIAEAAAKRGADVTLITSVHTLPIPAGCRPLFVRSAADMAEAVHAHVEDASMLIMSAAVADYKPKEVADKKMKKSDDALSIPLARTLDILASLTPSRHRVTVGFAAETHDVVSYAQGKLSRKKVDMIVANDVSKAGSGFGTETNEAIFVRPDKAPEHLPLLSKKQVAYDLLDRAKEIFALHKEART